ncbi:FAD-dependent oxidoreductase [Escherichia coli]
MDIIIGAGVTGLSYANFTKNDYLIIEGENEPGGYCRTIKSSGFTWDYSGHFFHFKNEHIKNYIFERMEHQEIFNVNKITSIYIKNTYIDFPFQKNIHQLPKDDFINCLVDLYEATKKDKKTNKYNSFKEMIYMNFGNTICDLFLIPYNEKLYATSLDRLDSSAMGRFFPNANFDDVIRNFRVADADSYNNSFVYPEGGAYEYIKALLKNIPREKIKLNEQVIKINIENKTITTSNGNTYHYSNLISTIPLNRFIDIADTNITINKETLTCNKVRVFNIGFDRPSNLNEHWIYYPEKDIVFYRVGFYDNIMQSDRMSLYVEIGEKFDSTDELAEEELLNRVLNDLKKVGVINDHKYIDHCYIEMNPAYVHINEQSESEKEKLFYHLETKNIYSLGRYGAWKYCSIEDNIIEAMNIANKINEEKHD